MRDLSNIEKSSFRKGQYVGYANGAWRIDKHNGIWRAIQGTSEVHGLTLERLNAQLAQLNGVFKPGQLVVDTGDKYPTVYRVVALCGDRAECETVGQMEGGRIMYGTRSGPPARADRRISRLKLHT